MQLILFILKISMRFDYSIDRSCCSGTVTPTTVPAAGGDDDDLKQTRTSTPTETDITKSTTPATTDKAITDFGGDFLWFRL